MVRPLGRVARRWPAAGTGGFSGANACRSMPITRVFRRGTGPPPCLDEAGVTPGDDGVEAEARREVVVEKVGIAQGGQPPPGCSRG
jgi:hypothetical protein